MGSTSRARVSLVLVLAVLRLGACSSPEDVGLEAAPRVPSEFGSALAAGSGRGWCLDGVNASGGACVSSVVDPLRLDRPRSLDWLLGATSHEAVSPRRDWRDGLGFVKKDLPLDDADVAALLGLNGTGFSAVSARERRRAVVNSARHAWRGYREHAWPKDVLAPISKTGVEWLGVGLTIVDSLDTLLVMGLTDEADEARAWAASDALAFDADKNANVFESTIRVLGGLTGAHGLGGDTPNGDLLKKALDLAEKLTPAFKTRTGIPIMDVNFKTGDPHHPGWTTKSSLAEAGTLVLEWVALEAALAENENATVGRTPRDDSADSPRDADEDFGEPDHEAVQMEYGFCPQGGGLKEYPVAREHGVADESCDAEDETTTETAEETAVSPSRRTARARSTLPALAGRGYVRDIADGARRAFAAVSGAMWETTHDGLVPSAVSFGTAAFDSTSALTLGARGDSFYEYLLKHWLHVGKPVGGEASYLRAMDGVLLYLLHRSGGDNNDPTNNVDGAGLSWGLTREPRNKNKPKQTSSSARARRRRWFEEPEGDDGDDAESGETTKDDASLCISQEKCETTDAAEGEAVEPIAPKKPKSSLGLLYVAERVGGVSGSLVHKMDHLVCFLPGVLALGHSEGLGQRWGGGDVGREGLAAKALTRLGFASDANHLDVAIELARTCVGMYASSPTGLAPEITHFPNSGLKEGGVGKDRVYKNGDGMLVKRKDAHNLLRPETVESLFVLWRVTGQNEWRDAGWAMWRAWELHARVRSGGYSGVDSVLDSGDSGADQRDPYTNSIKQRDANRIDKMESFWLSETLKYLFLLFTDDPLVVPLACFVFNTEAHPLPVLRRGVPDGRDCVEQVAREHVEELAKMQGVDR